MKYLTICFVAFVVFQASCAGSKENVEQAREFAKRESNGIAKIKIAESGDIYLNKKLTSLDRLNEELTRIKEVNGVVWYYRGSAAPEAEASADVVVKRIIEYRLPVKMCETDFE